LHGCAIIFHVAYCLDVKEKVEKQLDYKLLKIFDKMSKVLIG